MEVSVVMRVLTVVQRPEISVQVLNCYWGHIMQQKICDINLKLIFLLILLFYYYFLKSRWPSFPMDLQICQMMASKVKERFSGRHPVVEENEYL